MDILNNIFMIINICCFGGIVFSVLGYLYTLSKDKENRVGRQKYAYMFIVFAVVFAVMVHIGFSMNIARYQ